MQPPSRVRALAAAALSLLLAAPRAQASGPLAPGGMEGVDPSVKVARAAALSQLARDDAPPFVLFDGSGRPLEMEGLVRDLRRSARRSTAFGPAVAASLGIDTEDEDAPAEPLHPDELVGKAPGSPTSLAAVLGASASGSGLFDGLFGGLFSKRKKKVSLRPDLETKYPVVLCHGANTPKLTKLGPIKIPYFTGTEKHLRRLNLRLLVPSVDPFGSIADRAAQLEAQIREAIPEGKFNLVGHSMGGLDARYLATHSSLKDRIASITTVSTPHHGSWYADFAEKWLLEKQGLRKVIELLGLHMDQIPDLMVRHMEGEFNPSTPDNPDVKYFSYGTYSNPFASPPFYWGMNFIMRIKEQRAHARARRRTAAYGKTMPIGMRSKSGEVVVSKDAHRMMAAAGLGQHHDWIVPKWAGKNDGVVSLSSAVWGQYMGTIKAHHWGPMGWITRMKNHLLWEDIIRRLAAQGF